LFSQVFGVPAAELDKAGLLDPFLNADTKLFIDPLLLRHSKNRILKASGTAAFRKRMSDIVKLLMATQATSGPAWVAALGLLDLHERRETCLGYGGAGTSGSSRPDSLKARILNTTREIVGHASGAEVALSPAIDTRAPQPAPFGRRWQAVGGGGQWLLSADRRRAKTPALVPADLCPHLRRRAHPI